MASFRDPVGGIGVRELPARLQSAMADLERRFPGLGVTLFVFDFGNPEDGPVAMGYISTAERAGMRQAVAEWLEKTDPARG